MHQPHMHYESGITSFDQRVKRRWLSRLLTACILILALLWVGLPVLRAFTLVRTGIHGGVPASPPGLPVRSIHFTASDGVPLEGWFVPASKRSATVILVAGYKSSRESMVPYARFLHAAGYNVLLYDSRGTGQSGGSFSLGAREVDDVRGAVAYLNRRGDLLIHRYGLLGVSLGAGVVIVAAAHIPPVRATVADSAYTDQSATVNRLDSLDVGPIAIPLAPDGPWVVDQLLGVRLAQFSPLKVVRRIAPRGLLLIHSRHDGNPTTPLSGAQTLYRHAGTGASLWIAPRGGHAKALSAQPIEYARRVVRFFRRYLVDDRNGNRPQRRRSKKGR